MSDHAKALVDTTGGRRIISSAAPADVAERISDEPLSTLDARTEALLERELRLRVERCLTDPYFWADSLRANGEIRNALPDILARCMANLDLACGGEQIARDAITTALAQLQRIARPEAEEYPE